MVFEFLGFGFALLILGSEAALHGAIGLSRKVGLSPLLIGLLIMSAASAAPELSVSLQAVGHSAPDIAVGTVVGSNIINVLLILGLGALIRPLPSPPKIVFRDGGALVLASAAFLLMAKSGTISRGMGIVLIGAFILYFVLVFATDWRRSSNASVAECRAQRHEGQISAGLGAFLLLFGIVCVVAGARFLIDGAMAIGESYHIPQATLGLTMVALGTSLPELAVTFIATVRGRADIAVGQLVGASVFNILFVIGVTAAVHPLPVAPAFAAIDILVMLGAAILLMPLLANSWRLSRISGVMLMLGYAGYIVFVATRLGYHLPVPGLG
jgi:cation:H+ antiporter